MKVLMILIRLVLMLNWNVIPEGCTSVLKSVSENVIYIVLVSFMLLSHIGEYASEYSDYVSL